MAALLIGYAPCSTDQQDLTAQHDGLRALGVSPARIYLDHGLTGTNRDRSSARFCAAYGVYLPRARAPGSGPLRRSSRLTVEGARPIWVAIVRTPAPASCKSAIRSRSSKLRYRPEGSGFLRGTCPPVA